MHARLSLHRVQDRESNGGEQVVAVFLGAKLEQVDVERWQLLRAGGRERGEGLVPDAGHPARHQVLAFLRRVASAADDHRAPRRCAAAAAADLDVVVAHRLRGAYLHHRLRPEHRGARAVVLVDDHDVEGLLQLESLNRRLGCRRLGNPPRGIHVVLQRAMDESKVHRLVIDDEHTQVVLEKPFWQRAAVSRVKRGLILQAGGSGAAIL
mmetsp:Transcript_50719/g.110073  ORF Transcript_50719/g.110073 Transcript_50719/m.110073 type:complete len:209 (-) Transcript_50719:722-1348(-)